MSTSSLEPTGTTTNHAFRDISGPYEAIRLIKTTLRPVERSSLRYFRPDSLGEPPPIDPRCPTLHFSGSGKGSVGGSAIIEGRVFKTTDNNIRWQFVRELINVNLALLTSATGFCLRWDYPMEVGTKLTTILI